MALSRDGWIASRRNLPSPALGIASITGATLRNLLLVSEKALYGDAATKENDWAYDFLPKVDRNLFLDQPLGQHVQRHRQGPVRVRDERRSHRPGLQKKYRCAEKGGLAGGGRDLS